MTRCRANMNLALENATWYRRNPLISVMEFASVNLFIIQSHSLYSAVGI